MPASRIFISYRRDDAAGYARAIGAELGRCFGAEHVFMDADDIGAGQPFADVLQRAVGESEVLLVLIGPRWLGARADAPARIGEAGDFVRLEVAAGLARRMHVIPLLLDATPMPQAAQLPADLQPLCGLHALELGNTRFRADLDRLVQTLHEALGEPAPAAPPQAHASRPLPSPTAHAAFARWRLLGSAALVIALVALGWSLMPAPGGPRPAALPPAPGPATAPAPAPAAATSARPAIDGEWLAEVVYDWPNARYTERFVFTAHGAELEGTASFLRVPRGVLEGRALADGLSFVTRTRELPSGDEIVRRYRARRVDDTLQFVMQTEGGSAAHAPVTFSARRAGAAPAPAAR